MKKIAVFLLILLYNKTVIGQAPAIIMTTSKEIGSSIYFSLKSNSDSLLVDFGNGIKVTKTVPKQSETVITGILVGSQTIKIYGLNIIWFACSSMQLTSLDVTNDTELSILNCSNNELKYLDLTKNKALTYLTCNSNNLMVLDVTKNDSLENLTCNDNFLTTIDLSGNSELKILNCYSNQLMVLDISYNTELSWLMCNNNNLTMLDVTKNVALKMLSCYSNRIKELDVSKNIILTELKCNNNRLASLDVTDNEELKYLFCQNNHLNFSTLPVRKESWSNYIYAPQQLMSIQKSINTGAEMDLSSLYSINENLTTYTWKTKNGLVLVEDEDYSILSGKTVFFKSKVESVYCEMINAAFPDFAGADVLKTTLMEINQSSDKTQSHELDK